MAKSNEPAMKKLRDKLTAQFQKEVHITLDELRKKRTSFVVFTEWDDSNLTVNEKALLWDAMFRYNKTGEEPASEDLNERFISFLWHSMKRIFDRNNESYGATLKRNEINNRVSHAIAEMEKNNTLQDALNNVSFGKTLNSATSDSGQGGSTPGHEPEPDSVPDSERESDTDPVSVPERVSDTDVSDHTPSSFEDQFKIPTLDEVVQYFQVKHLNGNPNKFYDYYTTAKWVDNNRKSFRWQLKALSWSNNEKKNTSQINETDEAKKPDYWTPEFEAQVAELNENKTSPASSCNSRSSQEAERRLQQYELDHKSKIPLTIRDSILQFIDKYGHLLVFLALEKHPFKEGVDTTKTYLEFYQELKASIDGKNSSLLKFPTKAVG